MEVRGLTDHVKQVVLSQGLLIMIIRFLCFIFRKALPQRAPLSFLLLDHDPKFDLMYFMLNFPEVSGNVIGDILQGSVIGVRHVLGKRGL